MTNGQSTSGVDLGTLAQALAGLSGGNLTAVETKLMDAMDSLRDAIDAKTLAMPPQDASAEIAERALCQSWFDALAAAVGPSPPATANADLLAAMQALDAAKARSGALNDLLKGVDGLVKSF
jgi:hypothetical protein